MKLQPKIPNIDEISLPAEHISDEELVEKVKVDGFIAYGSLVRRYNQRLYRVARSIVTDDAAAMDVVQEAHIKAFTKIDTFKGESTFAAWVASIARNESLMYLRKYKNEVTMGDKEQSIMESLESNNLNEVNQNRPDNLLQNSQVKGLVNQNIDKLSDKFRSVFLLRAVEQFSTKETAKILKLNEITVKTRYFRAKRFLRNEIQDYLDSSNLNIYEFGHKKCDIVLQNVLVAISKL